MHALHAVVTPPADHVPAPHFSSLVTLVGCALAFGHLYPHGQSAQFALVPVPFPLYRPALHTPQCVWLDSYWPAGHAVHVVLPALTIQPAPQLEQLVTVPVDEYVPAPHADFVVRSWAPDPVRGHLLPPGHAPQFALVAVPAAAHCPFVHAEHAVCELSYLPDTHAVHVVAPTAALTIEPPPHTEQLWLLVEPEYSPAWHLPHV